MAWWRKPLLMESHTLLIREVRFSQFAYGTFKNKCSIFCNEGLKNLLENAMWLVSCTRHQHRECLTILQQRRCRLNDSAVVGFWYSFTFIEFNFSGVCKKIAWLLFTLSATGYLTFTIYKLVQEYRQFDINVKVGHTILRTCPERFLSHYNKENFKTLSFSQDGNWQRWFVKISSCNRLQSKHVEILTSKDNIGKLLLRWDLETGWQSGSECENLCDLFSPPTKIIQMLISIAFQGSHILFTLTTMYGLLQRNTRTCSMYHSELSKMPRTGTMIRI